MKYQKPEELKVMTWPLKSLWGKSLKEAVSNPFEKATGIKIIHKENIGTDHPEQLLTTLKNKERPPFDVIYGNTIPAYKMALEGYCDPLTEEEFPVLKEVSDRAKPVLENIEGYQVLIAYLVRYVMMYRPKAFPDGPPDSWSVMLDKKHKGRVSVYPAGKGFFPIAQVMGGGKLEDIPDNMEPCWNFLKQLKENIGPMGYNTAMTEHIKNDEIDVFFTVLTNIRQWKNQGYDVEWTVPGEGIVDGDDSLHVPVYLPDNVAYWAKKYIEFAFTEKIQKDWCHRLGLCPVFEGIEPPEDLIDDPVYPKSIDDYMNVLTVPNSILAQYEHGAWREKFNDIFN